MVIEAVLFDGDQTLWDFERVMRDALIAVLDDLRAARPGPYTSGLGWEDLVRDRAEVGIAWDGIEYSLARLRVLGFARTLERLRTAEGSEAEEGAEVGAGADAALTEELAASYFAHREADPALFADTLPCLETLHRRYRLGLLSNGSRLPETVGLGPFFEVVVFAQDHRIAKPDKGIFEIVERQLGLAPANCLLVGDHPFNDVVGAKRAGWSAVWLDREGEWAFGTHPELEGVCDLAGHEQPDAIVESLAELPATLEELDRLRR